MPLPPRALALFFLSLTISSCDAVEDVVDVVDPQPDLEIAIGASTLEVADGFEVVYTVVASNRGPAEATDVVVSIPVPDAIGGGRNFDAPPGTSCGGNTLCFDNEVIEWPLGTLAAGQSRALSVGIPVESGPSGYSYALSASVDSPTATSASATVTTQVDDTRASYLGLSTPSGSARPGGTVAFDLAYVVRATAVTSVVLRMPVPDGLAFSSATGGGTLSGSEVVWTVGTVPANTSGHVRATFQVDTGHEPGRPITAVARLAGASSVAASSQAVVVVPPPSHLLVTLQGNPESVRDGFEVTYSVQVSNAGTTAATDVVVSIPVPDAIGGGRNFDAPPGTSCGGNTLCFDNEVIEWPLGTLAAGQSRALSVGIPVESGPSGYLTGLSVSADSPNVAAGVATHATPVLE